MGFIENVNALAAQDLDNIVDTTEGYANDAQASANAAAASASAAATSETNAAQSASSASTDAQRIEDLLNGIGYVDGGDASSTAVDVIDGGTA